VIGATRVRGCSAAKSRAVPSTTRRRRGKARGRARASSPSCVDRTRAYTLQSTKHALALVLLLQALSLDLIT
jgi:hypothetical protein